MAKHKFGSNIYRMSEQERNEAFVDASGTQNFFQQKSVFVTYEKMVSEVLRTADRVTAIIGNELSLSLSLVELCKSRAMREKFHRTCWLASSPRATSIFRSFYIHQRNQGMLLVLERLFSRY